MNRFISRQISLLIFLLITAFIVVMFLYPAVGLIVLGGFLIGMVF